MIYSHLRAPEGCKWSGIMNAMCQPRDCQGHVKGRRMVGVCVRGGGGGANNSDFLILFIMFCEGAQWILYEGKLNFFPSFFVQ